MCPRDRNLEVVNQELPQGCTREGVPVVTTLIGIVIALLLTSAAVAKQQVWLMAGQSNMIGYGPRTGDLPVALQQPQSNVKIFTDANTGWISLRPGLGYDFGPELTFGRDMAAAQPGVDVLLVKPTFGLGSLYNDWRSPNTGRGPAGDLYANFVALEQAALASRPDAQIAGMIWMQGEADGSGALNLATSYTDNLRLFIASLRENVNMLNMPFVLGQISSSNAWANGGIVQQAQAEVARTTSNCYMVGTSDLPLCDNMHYSSLGQMELGSRFAQQALAAIGVPEPSTLNLLCMAVIGLLGFVWRKCR